MHPCFPPTPQLPLLHKPHNRRHRPRSCRQSNVGQFLARCRQPNTTPSHRHTPDTSSPFSPETVYIFVRFRRLKPTYSTPYERFSYLTTPVLQHSSLFHLLNSMILTLTIRTMYVHANDNIEEVWITSYLFKQNGRNGQPSRHNSRFICLHTLFYYSWDHPVEYQVLVALCNSHDQTKYSGHGPDWGGASFPSAL